MSSLMRLSTSSLLRFLSSRPAIAGRGDRTKCGGRGAYVAASPDGAEFSLPPAPPPPCELRSHGPPPPLSRGRMSSPVLAPHFAGESPHESFEISPDARRARRLPSGFAFIFQEAKVKQKRRQALCNNLRTVLLARRRALLCLFPPSPLRCGERVRRGHARLSAFHRGSRQRDASPKGSGPGQASWDPVSAGVTRGCLSQSSGSTPRTGRNAGEHDARTRPRAECIVPRASTAPRSTFENTFAKGVRK